MILSKQYATGIEAADAVKAWADSSSSRGMDLSRCVAFINCTDSSVVITTRKAAKKKLSWRALHIRKELKAPTRVRDLLVIAFDDDQARTFLHTTLGP